MISKATEYELLQQLIEGDAEAFRDIYELYQDKIFAFAYKLTKSKENADDIVQEVFIKLWQRREQIKVELNFGAYLKKMTQNQVYDFLKKVSRDRSLQEKIKQKLNALQNKTEEDLLAKELEKAYTEAIENLPQQRKLVYRLSREEDLSYDEIAERLNISRHTVHNQMVSAIRSIREYVTSHQGLISLIIAICISKK
jgi:RNA polymerase sigma-70 factor (ECF subfamily)